MTTAAARTAPSIDPELWEGLTLCADWGGAQVRTVANVTGWDEGLPVIDGELGQLVLVFKPDAPRSPENGAPYVLDQADARNLRDLLNIATARGIL